MENDLKMAGYVLMVSWWVVNFDPFQKLIERLAEMYGWFNVFVYEVLSCWKCLSFWMCMVLSLISGYGFGEAVFIASFTSWVSFIFEKIKK